MKNIKLRQIYARLIVLKNSLIQILKNRKFHKCKILDAYPTLLIYDRIYIVHKTICYDCKKEEIKLIRVITKREKVTFIQDIDLPERFSVETKIVGSFNLI